MTTITLPRATVEQALEAICSAKLCEFNSMSSRREMVRLMDEAITALRAALAQQAEPVEPNRWEGDHDIESPNNACMHKGYCMSLKQAREPMVQQAEPVEPVATVTECEACFTPDVCQLRGTCDHYAASQLRVATQPKRPAEPVEPVQVADRLARHGIPMPEGDPK